MEYWRCLKDPGKLNRLAQIFFIFWYEITFTHSHKFVRELFLPENSLQRQPIRHGKTYRCPSIVQQFRVQIQTHDSTFFTWKILNFCFSEIIGWAHGDLARNHNTLCSLYQPQQELCALPIREKACVATASYCWCYCRYPSYCHWFSGKTITWKYLY